ncbi:MAG: methyl-accepting chemotaxis protein [Deltaproteobacteria bacterium]|nr:methyl-accepting chemotaxis protein [Deltaproteobacteria bacterium]MBF0526045.1 methyl-accepting chemotaxis protein [Deltaproteobacteria bacterium]
MKRDCRRRIKNYLIDRELQLRIVLVVLIYILSVVIIELGLVFVPLVQVMVFSSDLEVQYRSAMELISLTQKLVPTLLVLGLAISIHLILLTHRICGPMLNFANAFKRISDGDLSRKVKIRQHDYLVKQQDEINRMIDGLNERLFQLREDAQRLRVIVDAAQADSDPTQLDKIATEVSSLERHLESWHLSQ